MSTKMERSYIPVNLTEVRAEKEGDKTYISGYASVYNQPTDKAGFREVVKPTAFDRALRAKQDVRVLFNHDPSKILGRTKSGTAELFSDNKGLKFRCEMPNTTTGNDVMESIKRGDIDQCSFGFVPVKQAWVNTPDPADKNKTITTRELHDVDLADVSAVTYPAYQGTSVGEGRSMSAMEFRSFFPEGLPDDVAENVKITVTAVIPPAEQRAAKHLVTEKDGTQHLPYTDADGAPNHHLAGAAWAALHEGYRANKYAGPNKAEAIAKLESLYKSQGWELPGAEKNSASPANCPCGECATCPECQEGNCEACCRCAGAAEMNSDQEKRARELALAQSLMS